MKRIIDFVVKNPVSFALVLVLVVRFYFPFRATVPISHASCFVVFVRLFRELLL